MITFKVFVNPESVLLIPHPNLIYGGLLFTLQPSRVLTLQIFHKLQSRNMQSNNSCKASCLAMYTLHWLHRAESAISEKYCKIKVECRCRHLWDLFSKIILCKINVSVKIKIETNNMMILKYFLAKKNCKNYLESKVVETCNVLKGFLHVILLSRIKQLTFKWGFRQNICFMLLSMNAEILE